MSYKLSEVRKTIPDTLRLQNIPLAWEILALDILVYICGFILACSPFPLNILGTILTGMVISSLFIWSHDAAHGALMPKTKVGFWGKLAMFPSGQIYDLWVLGHNRIHHGFTGLVEMDWIWKPLSPQEYQQLSKFQKWNYRMERHPLMTFWTYTRRVWFPGMVLFHGLDKDVRKQKLELVLFFTIASLIAYLMGGFTAILMAVILPFLLFQGTIGMVVYLNHTHPQTRFHKTRESWDMGTAQLHDSVTWRCRPWAEFWLHNILIHTPHHVDTRIPFYHLEFALEYLKQTYPETVIEERFSWHKISQYFKTCQLFDYEKQQWETFPD